MSSVNCCVLRAASASLVRWLATVCSSDCNRCASASALLWLVSSAVFLILLDGDLRGVKLLLNLRIILRHLVAPDGGSVRDNGGVVGVRRRFVCVRRKQPGPEEPHGPTAHSFRLTFKFIR